MRLVYSSHAVERMQARQISTQDVEEVMNSPGGTIQQSQDKVIYYKLISSRTDNQIAVVAVRALDQVYEILTVMHRFSTHEGGAP